MNTLIILLVQTNSIAIIEILSFLLIATVLEYITALIYYKSIYRKGIDTIESEMNRLRLEIVNLNIDKRNLNKKFIDTVNELEPFIHEVYTSKPNYRNVIQKTSI